MSSNPKSEVAVLYLYIIYASSVIHIRLHVPEVCPLIKTIDEALLLTGCRCPHNGKNLDSDPTSDQELYHFMTSCSL